MACDFVFHFLLAFWISVSHLFSPSTLIPANRKFSISSVDSVSPCNRMPESDAEKKADDYKVVDDALRKLREAKGKKKAEISADASKSEQTQE
jgi:hypothetical protein